MADLGSETDAQRNYDGPDELKIFADFLPHIGEFTLMFARIERYVTWAIESFIGASRWDGNELEGMVQNFSSRIKILDIVARPKCQTDDENQRRSRVTDDLKSMNAFRNKLIHNSATGIDYKLDKKQGLTKLTLRLKRLDPNSGKEHNVHIGLEELKQKPVEMVTLINDIKVFVHRHCPNAEKRVP